MIPRQPARDRSVEELLHHWPAVIFRADDAWTKGFTRSIAAESKRRNWYPTPKQLGVMQRLVSDFLAPVRMSDPDEDAGVIE